MVLLFMQETDGKFLPGIRTDPLESAAAAGVPGRTAPYIFIFKCEGRFSRGNVHDPGQDHFIMICE